MRSKIRGLLRKHSKGLTQIILAMVLLANIFWLGKAYREQSWDPILDSQPQNLYLSEKPILLADGQTKTLPYVTINKDTTDLRINLQFDKCVVPDAGSVRIQSTSLYEILEPVPVIVQGSTIETIETGCDHRYFSVLVPSTFINQVLSTGFSGTIIARLGAAETPVASNGVYGKTKTWTTEEFAVIVSQ